MVDPHPDEGFAICDACGGHLKGGEPIVYANRPMKQPIYWHKDCFYLHVKPFKGHLVARKSKSP